MATIDGEVRPGFEAVREAFAHNFEAHDEVGAAFSLYVRGEKVVDLWGGVADESTGRPWAEDTTVLVFSTTKGVTAICTHLLAQRGELDLDAPVATYWPEFKAEGKEDVPVRWLLSHRAGLPALARRVSPEEALAWDPIVEALAAEPPTWEPGTAHGYHALTFGWLVGEVVRRICGRSVGTFLADEVAGPLGLDVWIGLPDAEQVRVAPLVLMAPLEGTMSKEAIDALPEEMRDIAAAYFDSDSLTQRALSVTDPQLDYNSAEVRAAEIPAANGVATARSLAKLYASCVGEVEGVRLLNKETTGGLVQEQSSGKDNVLMVPTRFSSGFFLDSDFAPLFGSSSFGHPGAGGSLAFADIDAQIGFGYVMNKMQVNLAGDPRTLALIAAVKSSLA